MKLTDGLSRRSGALSLLSSKLSEKLRELPDGAGAALAESLAEASQAVGPLMSRLGGLGQACAEATAEAVSARRALRFFAQYVREILPRTSSEIPNFDEMIRVGDLDGFVAYVEGECSGGGRSFTEYASRLAALRKRLVVAAAAERTARSELERTKREAALALAGQEGTCNQARVLLRFNNVRVAAHRGRPQRKLDSTPAERPSVTDVPSANANGGIVAA